MPRGVLMAGCAGVLLCGQAWGGEAPLYRAASLAPLAQVFLGEFAPGTMERGPIETQTPAVKLPVSGLQLAIDTGGDTDCGAGLDAAGALAKPDVATTTAAADECLFRAEVTVTTTQGAMTFEGQCDDWRAGASYCWVEGDIGQFWLRRGANAGKSLQVMFGATGLATGAASIPARGIMLDSVFDDAGRAVSDRWLLLPPEMVALSVER